MRAHGLGAAALLLVAGCAAETKLRPTPEAGVLVNGKGGAITEQQGVRLVADGSAWRGSPSDLERRLTPVYVRLENQGQRPLKLQYAAFSLIGEESRFRYTALAPLSLQKAMSANDTAPSGVIAPAGHWSVGVGVGVGSSYVHGPRRGYYPPYYGPWGSPFYDPFLYSWPQYQEPLPTEDMLNNALPEGTLEPGGTQQGFLYFQGVARREDAVTLQVKLVDATTGEPFGALDIPFQVSTH
ncbi:hypothetical protein D7Y13_33450 [Corallococcus praedator]|uniref:DUF2381 family protein n=1 Tax=Corallococcus praedator TaxID=2316724 RepID=A0ABX9QAR2_9BACT|nr:MULTISPECIES: hypothetical protein [Corallococcus]RKH31703.1 hypothetical protein D7X75_18430 [Corallococcus sp. CA031C]RKH94259.1 hypothetical protein D7Y13_33450 [Corallococcus praedator]